MKNTEEDNEMKRMIMAVPLLAAGVALAACDSNSPVEPDTSVVRTFTVTLSVPPGSPSPLAPGVFFVHSAGMPIFTEGMADRGAGLEALAEDGDPSGLAQSGGTVFNTPAGDGAPGPATPGKSYSFSFDASPGHRLSFATMYVQSNDAFYSPSDGGLPLYDGSTPVTGNVTGLIGLWDAGTEVNQQPGSGPDQPLRQAGPNTGPAESAAIARIGTRDSFSYGHALEVTIMVR